MIKSLYLKQKGWHWDMPNDRRSRHMDFGNAIASAVDVLCEGRDVNLLIRGNFFDWDDKDEVNQPASYWMYFDIHQIEKYDNWDGSCKLVFKIGKTQNCDALNYKEYVSKPDIYKVYCFSVDTMGRILRMMLEHLDDEWA